MFNPFSKKHRYETINDIKHMSANDIIHIDPNNIKSNIADNNKDILLLSPDQQNALKKLLAIKRVEKTMSQGQETTKLKLREKEINKFDNDTKEIGKLMRNTQREVNDEEVRKRYPVNDGDIEDLRRRFNKLGGTKRINKRSKKGKRGKRTKRRRN